MSGRTRSLAVMTLIFVSISACVALRPTPTYRAEVPPRPEFTHAPEDVTCMHVASGQEGACVVVWKPDWVNIGVWALTLERNLKAACLALGGTDAACGSSPPSSSSPP